MAVKPKKKLTENEAVDLHFGMLKMIVKQLSEIKEQNQKLLDVFDEAAENLGDV